MWTRYWLLSAHLVLLAGPRYAAAADRVQECIGEHVEAQLLRKQGRWVQARARLLECSAPTCPALVRDECAALERDVEAALPSVILGALDADGEPTLEPRVRIDGAPEPVPLDGRAIWLDPGQHQLRFQHPEGETRDVELVLMESEHDRRVIADFRPKADRDGASNERRWPTSVMIVSGGVAAGALASFTYFALSGYSVQSDLSRCKPNCDNPAEVDRMRSRYLIADVSLGIALVSVGVAAYAWTQRPAAALGSGSPSSTRVAIGLRPVATRGGGGLWAVGQF